MCHDDLLKIMRARNARISRKLFCIIRALRLEWKNTQNRTVAFGMREMTCYFIYLAMRCNECNETRWRMAIGHRGHRTGIRFECWCLHFISEISYSSPIRIVLPLRSVLHSRCACCLQSLLFCFVLLFAVSASPGAIRSHIPHPCSSLQSALDDSTKP